MSDEFLNAKLEREAAALPKLTGPETRGFRVEEQFTQDQPPLPPPPLPDELISRLDMSKPQGEPCCPVCGKPLQADAHIINTPDGQYYACRGCKT